jgi:hypothetical protein
LGHASVFLDEPADTIAAFAGAHVIPRDRLQFCIGLTRL